MTATSDRVAAKALCVDTLDDHLAAVSGMEAVSVHFDDPGEHVTDEMVIFGTMTGSADPVAFSPTGDDDVFAIRTAIFTTGHTSALEAAQRCQAILDELTSTLFRTSFARSLNGRVFPGRQDGPNAVAPMAGEPASAVCELDVNVSIPSRGA